MDRFVHSRMHLCATRWRRTGGRHLLQRVFVAMETRTDRPFAFLLPVSDRHRSARAPHRARSQQETYCREYFMITVTVGPLPVFLRLLDLSYGTNLSPKMDLTFCGGFCWCTPAPCLRSVRLGSCSSAPWAWRLWSRCRTEQVVEKRDCWYGQLIRA